MKFVRLIPTDYLHEISREVRKIILQNFDEIVEEWQSFRSQQNG